MDTDAFVLELADRFGRDFSHEHGWQNAPCQADFDRWLSGATGNQITDRFNDLGTVLARRYHSGEYHFLLCDWVINRAESELMERVVSDRSFEYPQLFEEIYRAFDAGEWDHHGRSEQPIIDYTDPLIAAIVARLGQSD